jgi:hypothetical protein
VGANDTRIMTLSTSIGLVERGKQALRGCTCVYVCVCVDGVINFASMAQAPKTRKGGAASIDRPCSLMNFVISMCNTQHCSPASNFGAGKWR